MWCLSCPYLPRRMITRSRIQSIVPKNVVNQWKVFSNLWELLFPLYPFSYSTASPLWSGCRLTRGKSWLWARKAWHILNGTYLQRIWKGCDRFHLKMHLNNTQCMSEILLHSLFLNWFRFLPTTFIPLHHRASEGKFHRHKPMDITCKRGPSKNSLGFGGYISAWAYFLGSI